ncbi:MAG: MFS transporter [Candidatus Margulisbacteria bacterium]|nr:MFS transporter [Candidatus Margulisiibacteriota bacterium]
MDTNQKLKYWKKRIFWSIWITYACFYLVRVNMSVALPGIMGEYGISKTAMGGVLTALFTMYAIGQFVNGQLADKFGARKLISIGIIVSAVLSMTFGFTNGWLTGMIIVWGLNGFFQAMGWSPSVKTIANWFPLKMRTKKAGLLGTSYQIGSAASWALSGFIVGLLGWRWAFFVPAIIAIVIGLHWAIRGRNAPEEVGLPTAEEQHEGRIGDGIIKKDNHLGFKYTLKTVLLNKRVWTVALGLFCLNIVRYGFMDWAPTYLFEVQKAAISTAAFKSMIIPLAGSLGTLYASFIARTLFKHRKAPIASIMLFFLALFCFIFPKIPVGNWIISLIFLAIIGFTTYGPHVLMVTALPMDYGSRKAAASVTGFIDGWGYIGAALTGVGTGFLIDNFGWNYAFYFWVLGAVGAAILMLTLWNQGPVKGKYH